MAHWIKYNSSQPHKCIHWGPVLYCMYLSRTGSRVTVPPCFDLWLKNFKLLLLGLHQLLCNLEQKTQCRRHRIPSPHTVTICSRWVEMPVIIALYSAVFGELQAPQEILERHVLFTTILGGVVCTASGWPACAIQPSHTPLLDTRVEVSIWSTRYSVVIRYPQYPLWPSNSPPAARRISPCRTLPRSPHGAAVVAPRPPRSSSLWGDWAYLKGFRMVSMA